MEYKLPPLPSWNEVIDGLWEEVHGPYDMEDMRQYAEQAVAPLLAEIERLKLDVCFALNGNHPGKSPQSKMGQ